MTEQHVAEQQPGEINPAETYESYMVPALFGPWAAHLIRTAEPRAGERVLDVGCGTGIVARRIAPHVGPAGKVVGLDLSPHMLAVARAVAERDGLSIEWREGQAEQLPFPDGGFDLAVCQFALMFFADQKRALSEMRRVLVPGGRVALSVFQDIARHPFYQALDEAIQRHLGVPGVQQIFALGDDDALLALLTDAGFGQVEIEPVTMTSRFPDPAGFLAGEIDVDTAAIPSMQHLDAQARQRVVAAITSDMAAPLHDVTEDEHVVLPFHVQMVRAWRRD